MGEIAAECSKELSQDVLCVVQLGGQTTHEVGLVGVRAVSQPLQQAGELVQVRAHCTTHVTAG